MAYLVNDSIKMQLRSDVPIGAHLSGGLDSSIVSMIASKYSENNFHTFSGGFTEGDEYDETYFAKIVSEKAKTSHHSIFPTELDFVENINKIIWHMDYPSAGPGVFPQYFLSNLASKNVKVVLGGQGGDELFGGYIRYVIAYLEEAIKGSIFQNQINNKHIVTLETIIPNKSNTIIYTLTKIILE